jgi:hypothetical protein
MLLVVDDAIRFVSQKSKERIKSSISEDDKERQSQEAEDDSDYNNTGMCNIHISI